MKQTPWNSHRLTPDDAVHRLDGTTHITSLHGTLKKKKKKKKKKKASVQLYLIKNMKH